MPKQYPAIIGEWLAAHANHQPDITYASLTNIEVKRSAIYMLKRQTRGQTSYEQEETYLRFMDFCARACSLVLNRPGFRRGSVV